LILWINFDIRMPSSKVMACSLLDKYIVDVAFWFEYRFRNMIQHLMGHLLPPHKVSICLWWRKIFRGKIYEI
jgi:hypothetical protein